MIKVNVFIFLLITFNSFSQQILEIRNKAEYPFLLSLPEKTILDSIPPVLIFLHGRSLSGNNLDLVKKYGVIDAIERGRKINAIVIAPQVSSGSSWNPSKILSTLEYVQKNYKTDTNRIYVTGMSLGGYGTTYFAGAYPEKIAAAVALCGGGKKSDACNLAKTNIWIQHGKLDYAVAHSESVEIYEAIKSCDKNSICYFTSYPNADHGDLASEFYRDEIYDWMFQFALNTDSRRMDQMKIEASKIFTKKGVQYNYSNEKSNKEIEVKKEDVKEKIKTEDVKEVVQENTSKIKKSKTKTHTVKKGDTLSQLAKKYNTTVTEIQRKNKLKSTTIRIGEVLKIN